MALSSYPFRDNARLQAAALNNPVMKKGESGAAVALLQKTLVDLGYSLAVSTAGGKPDGIFGKETKARVAAFQKDAGLDDDGIVGGQTLAALDGRMGVDEFEIMDHFEIKGTPAPDNLPKDVIWNPAAYKAAVKFQLVQHLQQSSVARAVVRACQRRIRVHPAPDAKEARAFWDPNDRFLNYTPGVFHPASKLYVTPEHWIGFSPDAVLLHEIVHAMRDTTGHYYDDQETLSAIRHPPWTTGMSPSKHLFFGKRGELNAIVIANIYLSEKQPGLAISGFHREMLFLVRDHHLGYSTTPLPAPLMFHKTPAIKRMLKKLWKEQPSMCAMIAAARAPFNPIRDVDRS